jgi:hypothetical protein
MRRFILAITLFLAMAGCAVAQFKSVPLQWMPDEIRTTAIPGSRVVTATVGGILHGVPAGPITTVDVPHGIFDKLSVGTSAPTTFPVIALSNDITFSSTATATTTYNWIYLDSSTHAIELTLPTVTGAFWWIKCTTHVEPITVKPATGFIDGNATLTKGLEYDNDAIFVRCDGVNQWVY